MSTTNQVARSLFIEEFNEQRFLAAQFDTPLRAWHEYTLATPIGNQVRWREERGADVVAAVTELRAALEKLGDRTDARAEAAREWLTSRLSRLEGALAAYDALGPERNRSGTFLGLKGELGVALLERFRAAREAVDEARERFEHTPAAEIREARDALDVAEAELREVLRGLTSARDAARRPHFDLAPLKAAEEQTRLLAHAIRHEPNTKAIHISLDQGRDASADTARLFVVFEPRKGHEAYTFRAQRAAEK